jgi:hypothetical protein
MNIYLYCKIFLKGISGRIPLMAKIGMILWLAWISEDHGLKVKADYSKELKCKYLGVQILTS